MEIENVRFTTTQTDERPAVVLDEVHRYAFQTVEAEVAIQENCQE